MICDLHLDASDEGTIVLKAYQRANPDAVSVLISGSLNTDSLAKAVNEGGIWKCLSKPFTLEEIRTVVSGAIEEQKRRKLHAENAAALESRETIVVNVTPRGEVLRLPVPRTPRDHEELEEPFWLQERYKLHSLIGEGGLGEVYAAEDTLLKIPVAVKSLQVEHLKDPLLTDMFLNEARVTLELSHPHIVRFYSILPQGDRVYMVMEYIKGHALRHLMAEYGTLPTDIVNGLVQACGSALQLAHDHGMVHCDIKPDNLLLARSGTPKLIDFGLARLLANGPQRSLITGTVEYMSPEQARGEELGPGTDQFSLALMAYELLSGALPSPCDIVENGTPYHALTAIPNDLKSVFTRALQSRAEDRYPSMLEFMESFAFAVRRKAEAI